MRKDRPHTGADTRSASPLSLNRLREAFAAMLGGGEERGATNEEQGTPTPATTPEPQTSRADRCEISPRSVVEALLFVGRPNNEAFGSRELAALLRGCSPTEIEVAVAELNRVYSQDEAPYQIVGTPTGYRLALRDEFTRMRDKFYGRVWEARLSTAALEVLSIVAYNQPATAEEVNQLRGAPSGSALATLVRLRLLRLDRGIQEKEPVRYSTTDRFLRLFGLENLASLPQSEELEKT